jgi:DNA-binding response OmpR family regulator
VDDEPTILELLSGSLRFAGFDVVTASNGAQALRVASASRPDLILLDVMMPDGDGFEVVRQMRATGPQIPVIFLTARSAVGERVAGLTLGGDDYVTKPFSLDEVLARICAVSRRSGQGQGLAGSRLTVADLDLDEDSHEVRRGGELVALTPDGRHEGRPAAPQARFPRREDLTAGPTPPDRPARRAVATSGTASGRRQRASPAGERPRWPPGRPPPD